MIIVNKAIYFQVIYMTYSIVARLETNGLGVCVSTGADPAVGSVVPHVEAYVEAIATQARQAAGGSTRGRRAAALLVKKVPPYTRIRPHIDLRVDDHPDSVVELRRIYEAFKVSLVDIKTREAQSNH